MRLDVEGRALLRLGAVVEKSDAGIIYVHDPLCIKAAHVAELEKILGSALRVCSAVNEHKPVFTARKYRCHRRTANTVHTLYDQCCTGKKCAR